MGVFYKDITKVESLRPNCGNIYFADQINLHRDGSFAVYGPAPEQLHAEEGEYHDEEEEEEQERYDGPQTCHQSDAQELQLTPMAYNTLQLLSYSFQRGSFR